jgi:hypothetical protein
MPQLTDTQTLILTCAANRRGNLAMPLPEGLHGAAAKMSVSNMIARGWLEEVDADMRKGEPLWRETGDGHGTTLVVTDAGMLAVGIEPVVVKTMAAVRNRAAEKASSKAPTSMPTPRSGTKQSQVIALLRQPEGASIGEIVVLTGWAPHSARGMISGALGKKLGLVVTSAKQADRGRVYRIDQPAT